MFASAGIDPSAFGKFQQNNSVVFYKFIKAMFYHISMKVCIGCIDSHSFVFAEKF